MTVNGLFVRRTCHFSACRTWRYELRIIWDEAVRPVMFIGLNPSTADEENDDPTIRRCIDFARRWSAGGLVMANACAYRATDPKVMLAFKGDQIGPENTVEYLQGIAAECAGNPIAAWGKHANGVSWLDVLVIKGGDATTVPIKLGDHLKVYFGPLDCLRLNNDGSPAHPLYLPAHLTPIPFNYVEGV